MQSPFGSPQQQPMVPPPIFSPTTPNNTMNPTQGEPKRKRVQVPAACTQCKRAHAACSNTRPCDRCVRINQAAACIAGTMPATRPLSGMPVENITPTPILNNPIFMEATVHPMPAVAPSPNALFNESDISKFLFEDNQDQFSLGELAGGIECLEHSCGGSDSDMGISTPSAYSTPSPALSSSSSLPSTPSPYTQSPPATPSSVCGGGVPSPQQATFTFPSQNATVGPSASAVAASIALQNGQTHNTQAQQMHDVQQNGQPQNTHNTHNTHNTQMHEDAHKRVAGQSHSLLLQAHAAAQMPAPVVSPEQNPPFNFGVPPPPSNMVEAMMSELLQQNKKMENMMLSLNNEMKTLQQEVSVLRAGGPNQSAVVTKIANPQNIIGPATAVWTVNGGVLVEHNQRFAQLLDLMEVPAGYNMQNFFGGPCSKAASARMNHHLENITNAQPVTDYAVVERKKSSGEVMRLMIVVNVVPTTVPVFLTTMYEL